MAQKIQTDAGEEIEVYTAEEVKAQVDEATKKVGETKDAEFGKTKAQLDSELTAAKTALGERAGEFKNFRELHKDVVDKLDVAQRTIYENQLLQKKQDDARIAEDKKRQDASIDAAIRSKAGTDEKLFGKMKEAWGIIGVNATTPEEIEKKTMMVLGMLNTTEPNLLANVTGFSGRGFIPPVQKKAGEGDSFADSERGKAAAADLGMVLEPPKKK